MVTDFVEQFAKMIANHPEDIQVEAHNGDEMIEIVLHANQADVGKLIGKEGKMIGAVRPFQSVNTAKDGKSYRINVEAIN